jgi:hypothetical protein
VHLRDSRRKHSCHGPRDALAEQYVGAGSRRLRKSSAFEIGGRQKWVALPVVSDAARAKTRHWPCEPLVHREYVDTTVPLRQLKELKFFLPILPGPVQHRTMKFVGFFRLLECQKFWISKLHSNRLELCIDRCIDGPIDSLFH